MADIFDRNTKVLIIIFFALFFLWKFFVSANDENERRNIFPVALLFVFLTGFVSVTTESDRLDTLFYVAIATAIVGVFTILSMPKTLTLFRMSIKLSDDNDNDSVKEAMTLKMVCDKKDPNCFCDERARSCIIACSKRDRKLDRDCYETCKENSPIC